MLNTSNNANLSPSLLSLATVARCTDQGSFAIQANMADYLALANPNARPEHFRNLFEECIFVFAIMMATSATTFIQGVIVINTATIGNDLKMTSAQVTWIAAAIGCALLSPYPGLANILQTWERIIHALLWEDGRSL